MSEDASETPAVRLPILGVDPARLTPVALVVGDPARARQAADLLDDIEEVGSNREYLTLVGGRGGARIVVASHGVGAAGANICFAELIRGGVTTVVRAGTCGAIVPGLTDGDLVLATGAVRDDGASDQLIDMAYPAVSDRGVANSLARAAAGRGIEVNEGIVVTEATFYPGAYPPRWQRYNEYGAVAVEMEMASLLVIASMNGVRAGGVLTVDGNLVDERSADMTDYDPHRSVVREGVATMLEIALDAAAELRADA